MAATFSISAILAAVSLHTCLSDDFFVILKVHMSRRIELVYFTSKRYFKPTLRCFQVPWIVSWIIFNVLVTIHNFIVLLPSFANTCDHKFVQYVSRLMQHNYVVAELTLKATQFLTPDKQRQQNTEAKRIKFFLTFS